MKKEKQPFSFICGVRCQNDRCYSCQVPGARVYKEQGTGVSSFVIPQTGIIEYRMPWAGH